MDMSHSLYCPRPGFKSRQWRNILREFSQADMTLPTRPKPAWQKMPHLSPQWHHTTCEPREIQDKITPWLLVVHLSNREKSSHVSVSVVWTNRLRRLIVPHLNTTSDDDEVLCRRSFLMICPWHRRVGWYWGSLQLPSSGFWLGDNQPNLFFHTTLTETWLLFSRMERWITNNNEVILSWITYWLGPQLFILWWYGAILTI